MNSPQRHERRDFRFPLHLPVLVRLAQRKEMHTHSENISLNGMLLSSSCLIPEGSTVEVSVGADHRSDTGILLSARGRVIRVHPKDSGDFSVAIKLEAGFSIPQVRTELPQSLVIRSLPKKPPFPTPPRTQSVSGGLHFGLAWHTET